MRPNWETMTSVSAGHIILTPNQPVGSGRPQRESNPGPLHQESRALPTELPRPLAMCNDRAMKMCITIGDHRGDAKVLDELVQDRSGRHGLLPGPGVDQAG